MGSSLIRPSDEPVLYPDVTKLEALGWRPKLTLKQTLADVLEYWRRYPDLIPRAEAAQ